MAASPMTVKGMVTEWLIRNDYSGLYNPDGECGCAINDLFPCENEGCIDCHPGYKGPCDGTCEEPDWCEYHVGPVKPGAQKEGS